MMGIPMKNHYTYGTYMSGNFNTCMGKLKMKHLPHDGRHTFASLMDSAGANDVCIKLIMGHSMKNDTTKGTYTHKTLEELLAEVNKIQAQKLNTLIMLFWYQHYTHIQPKSS